jgi:hypothetical protein
LDPPVKGEVVFKYKGVYDLGKLASGEVELLHPCIFPGTQMGDNLAL